MSAALALIAQHGAVTALGIVAAVLYYVNTYQEEDNNLVKFGPAYERYRQRVPRLNFFLGIIRWLGRRGTAGMRKNGG
jgi:protein-S-isoprenylcysteine O-methyltransferase Ste14